MDKQLDYGTPASKSEERVTLQIDGTEVTVPKGSSIIHAAAVAGISIPKLCATDSLHAFGSCRMCLVEVEGRRGYPASCTTPVDNGLKVHRSPFRLPHLCNQWRLRVARYGGCRRLA